MAYSASSIFYFPNPNPNPISPKNGVVSSSNKLFGTKNSFFLGSKLVSKTARITTRPEPVTLSESYPISAESRSFDVVIVGAGIIGLTIARQFLIGSDIFCRGGRQGCPLFRCYWRRKHLYMEIPKMHYLSLLKVSIFSIITVKNKVSISKVSNKTNEK